MKKIVMGIAAAAMAASIFAVDFAARTAMEGSILSGSSAENSPVNVLTLNKKDQKDADALVLSANLDKAGAQFQLWYNYAGGDMDPKIRNASLWFKPVDQLKVTVGDISIGDMKETLHWWKDPTGDSISASRSWAGKYSGFSTVEGSGINFNIAPVDGLSIDAGVAPGAGNPWITLPSKGDATVLAYGVGASYNLQAAADLPLTIAASWRDEGTDKRKILAIGGKYGNRWGDGFYGFLNVRCNFAKEGEDTKLGGIAFDNHFKFQAGAFQAQLRAPVIVRLTGNDGDPSYLEFSGNVEYALDGFTPYFLFGSDLDNSGEIAFDNFGDDFLIQLQPGVKFNVGACALNVAARVNVSAGAERTIGWSVPFTAEVVF